VVGICSQTVEPELDMTRSSQDGAPETAHNKVIAALNQLWHHCHGVVLSNLICSRHLQTALRLSTLIATRSDPGLSDLMLICNREALIHKTHYLKFSNCPPQLPESCRHHSRSNLTLVGQIRH
jgi:hypothetical protein